jgi:hypothetical protein
MSVINNFILLSLLGNITGPRIRIRETVLRVGSEYVSLLPNPCPLLSTGKGTQGTEDMVLGKERRVIQ